MSLLALGVFGAALAARAVTNVELVGPATPVGPGTEFTMTLRVNYTSYSVVPGIYSFKISFDKSQFELVSVKYGNYTEFQRPSVSISSYYNYLYISDTNKNYGGICASVYTKNFAYLLLRAKKDATPGMVSNFNFVTSGAYPTFKNCAGGTITPAYVGAVVTVYDYEETTTHLQQYLDLNADASWVFDEKDLDFMNNLLVRNKLNVENPLQVKMGGIQMDFMGHARAGYYDLARPAYL